MNLKELSTKFIWDWFNAHRPEVKMSEAQAAEFYEQIKDELLFVEKNNDIELVYLLLRNFLDSYYSSATDQVCAEVVEEEEFAFTTEELKIAGFFTEELMNFTLKMKKQKWYKEYEEEEEEFILEDPEFREQVRISLRVYGWNDLIESV